VATKWTQLPFPDALDELLKERKLTWRGLGRQVGVSQAHLSRIRTGRKTATVELIEDVAASLGIDSDYFIEVRVATIVDRVMADAAVRDRLYSQLRR